MRLQKEHIIFSMSKKESIQAKQVILKKKKTIYKNLVESTLSKHHEICKVLKHQLSCGDCCEVSKEKSSEEDISLGEELKIGM